MPLHSWYGHCANRVPDIKVHLTFQRCYQCLLFSNYSRPKNLITFSLSWITVAILGDFNICINKYPQNVISQGLLNSWFIQMVTNPTHTLGGYIDHYYVKPSDETEVYAFHQETCYEWPWCLAFKSSCVEHSSLIAEILFVLRTQWTLWLMSLVHQSHLI